MGIEDVRIKNDKEMKLTSYTKYKDIKTLINNLYVSNE